jgi:hypothetical protein
MFLDFAVYHPWTAPEVVNFVCPSSDEGNFELEDLKVGRRASAEGTYETHKTSFGEIPSPISQFVQAAVR